MPSGPPEMHVRWCKKDPNGFGDMAAIRYLEERGWVQTETWMWVPPRPGYVSSAEELDAVQYLILEWDWGGIADADSPPH